MQVAELFQFLHQSSSFGGDDGGGQFLLGLSDASIIESFRGPGKNKLYGVSPENSPDPEARRKRLRDTAQRWYKGTRKIPRDTARFWKSKFYREGFIDYVHAVIQFDTRKDWYEIFKANGYQIAKEMLEDKLADMLLTGLTNLQSGNPNIDDQPWNPSLVEATAKDLATEIGLKPRIANLKASDIYVEAGWLVVGGYRVQLPGDPKVSVRVTNFEHVYTTQMLAAFSEELGAELTVNKLRDIGGEYLEDFDEARRCYYLTDALRALLIDTALDGEEEFAKIKTDTYDGVRPTYRKPHASAYAKMTATLEQATTVPLTSSHVPNTTGLFRSAQRQGLTHMLVNEGRLKWVTDEQ